MTGVRRALLAGGLSAALAACTAPPAPPRATAPPDPERVGAPIRWTPPELSTDRYESSPAFSPDGRELYFVRADANFRGYRILWSRCYAGRWDPPREVPFAAPAPVLEADPALTPDGQRLYYVSTRHAHPGDDFDIWYVDRREDGTWGEPRRLPEPVNSTASELLPRVGPDGRLYFGSSRSGGFGQSDIYIATPTGPESWTVENLGPPVSTSANEYEAEISRDGRSMIVVADRGDRSHLYRFVLREGVWVETGRIPADPGVFQVGPLLSPRVDRLLFAQAGGTLSGEIFLVDLAPEVDESWPPRCTEP